MNKNPIEIEAKKLVASALKIVSERGYEDHLDSDCPQSIPDGTRVTFSILKGEVSKDDWGDDDSYRVAETHNGQTAVIDCLATSNWTEEDPVAKDFEYYDITFDDGVTLHAISGYHLEPKNSTIPDDRILNPDDLRD